MLLIMREEYQKNKQALLEQIENYISKEKKIFCLRDDCSSSHESLTIGTIMIRVL
jgi:hypothetical protein